MEVLKFRLHWCGQLHKTTVGKDVSRPVQFHKRLSCNIDHSNDFKVHNGSAYSLAKESKCYFKGKTDDSSTNVAAVLPKRIAVAISVMCNPLHI